MSPRLPATDGIRGDGGHRRIGPSLFAADPLHLARDMDRAGAADYFHVDVMDGIFVSGTGWGLSTVEAVAAASSLPVEVHLMVRDVRGWIDALGGLGCARLVFHVEAVEEPERLRDLVHRAGSEAGLAVSPSTPVEALREHLAGFDAVLMMTAEPGIRGTALVDDAVDRCAGMRGLMDRRCPGARLEVDGAVDLGAARQLSAVGVDDFVVGRALFDRGDVAENLASFRAAVEAGAPTRPETR